MNSPYFIPGLFLALLCTAGCSGLMEETFTLPAGTSGPPLTGLWEGAMEATGIEEESGMMSGFDLVMGEDGRIILMELSFSGEVDGERRYFNAYRQQDGTVIVRPIADRLIPGTSHPGQVFKDLEAVGPATSFQGNDWTIHLRDIQNVNFDYTHIPVYLMENGTLTPLDWVSTAGAEAPVFYFSACKVAVSDEVVTTEHKSSVRINSSGGECIILFTPEEVEKTSYRRMDAADDPIPTESEGGVCIDPCSPRGVEQHVGTPPHCRPCPSSS